MLIFGHYGRDRLGRDGQPREVSRRRRNAHHARQRLDTGPRSGLIRDVYRKSGAFFTPGSELRVKFVRPDHPLAYGHPEVTSAFRTWMPVCDFTGTGRRNVVPQWGTRPRTEDREEAGLEPGKARDPREQAKKDEVKMLVSGAVKGEDELEGRPAILDLPAGRGRVLAYNFNPSHRGLNRSDYRFFWNALLNWNALPPADKAR